MAQGPLTALTDAKFDFDLLVSCCGGSGDGIMCECFAPHEWSYGHPFETAQAIEFDKTLHAQSSAQANVTCRESRGGGGRGGGGDDHNACVLYEVDAGIATLTLNRPKSKNAFNVAMYARVTELLDRAEKDESVVVVVLTGAGNYFTSGADIKEIETSEPPKSPMSQQPFGRFALALLRFPKLVVAAVNGPAVGVGVTLLPHCDIVYAYGGNRSTAAGGRGGERPAYFWTPFFRLAIVPEFCSSVTFPEILGRSLANEMLVMGRKITAREALSAGLVSTLVNVETPEAFLRRVKDDLKRTVLANFMAAESASTFKRIMGRNRRPGLLQVLEGEFIDLDRRMQAGRPKAALAHLSRLARHPSSRL